MSSPPLGYRRGPRMTVSVPVAAASADILPNDFVTVSAGGFATKVVADGALYGVCINGAASPAADGGTEVLLDTSEETIYEMACSAAPTEALIGKSTDISGEQEVLGGAGAPTTNNIVVHEIKVASGTVYVSIVRDAVVPKT